LGCGNSRTIGRERKNCAPIENARDLSLWRFNLDVRVVQPAVASSGIHQRRTLQLSLPLPPLAAPARNFRLAPTAPHSGSTGGRLPRLGSAWFRSARPVANPRLTSGVARFRSTDGDPSGLRRTTPPSARPAINCRLTPDLDPLARLARTTSGFHRLLLQLQACAVCCCNPRACARVLPPFCQTGGELPTRIGGSTLRLYRFRFAKLAPGVSTSGWAFDTPLTSTEPCIAS
jgi:hypothetical protein